MSERAFCPVCGRYISVYVPRDGDGTTVRFRPHTDLSRRKCEGQFYVLSPVTGRRG